jgi:hypothetical protein
MTWIRRVTSPQQPQGVVPTQIDTICGLCPHPVGVDSSTDQCWVGCCINLTPKPQTRTNIQVLALTEITGVKGARARLLYKAGLRTAEAVAATDLDRCAVLLFAC